MAKQTKKAPPNKRATKPAVTTVIHPAPPPSRDDFKRARDLLRQRADALVHELAARYLASAAEELTNVLDALDSLAEVERIQPVPSP
jgi:hypothetical protein